MVVWTSYKAEAPVRLQSTSSGCHKVIGLRSLGLVNTRTRTDQVVSTLFRVARDLQTGPKATSMVLYLVRVLAGLLLASTAFADSRTALKPIFGVDYEPR